MIRFFTRTLKNVLIVRRAAVCFGIFMVIGIFCVLQVFDISALCDSNTNQVLDIKLAGSENIDAKVLAQLKKRWALEYEEERRLNDNSKFLDGGDSKADGRRQAASGYEPIDCRINDDYTVACLRESDSDNIYMPWTFLDGYYEVYGKLKHDDGYDRFEFSQCYAKILYEVGKQYNHDGVFLTFETYNVEIRDRVKLITGVEGVPLSTQWGPQGYFYPIQIAQFGLSHYSKNLTEKRPRRTVYEDGEMTVQAKWKTTNRHCVIENIEDEEKATRVIKFTTPTTIPYGSGVSLTLGNTMEYEFSFDIKFITNGSISVLLDTTEKKQYYIHYVTNDKLIEYDHDTNVMYGIGSRTEWSHISRDLHSDLRKGVGVNYSKTVKKSKIGIRKVVKLVIRGEGLIDNITILTADHMTHFRDSSYWLLSNQNPVTGGWPIMVERNLDGFPPLSPGWQSAMAQGHGLSVLVRAYRLTRNEKYMLALRKALLPFTISSAKGGVRAVFMDKYVWYEEYPTTPSSFVLNGFIFSLLGIYDFKMLLAWERKHKSVTRRKFTEDDEIPYQLATKLFDEGMASLKTMLPLFDGGSRTFYDLRHFQLKVQPNIARWDYHTTHMSQLSVLATIDDDPIFNRFYEYWLGYMKGKTAKHN